ncbi:MAG: PKD domain-containing protein [candidate division Zixibacteria bacterium]|nr:PKD domain-containing protein [candidate division Zixibacteria bacterium]
MKKFTSLTMGLLLTLFFAAGMVSSETTYKKAGNESEQILPLAPVSAHSPAVLCGDYGGDGSVDISDLTILLDYLFISHSPIFDFSDIDDRLLVTARDVMFLMENVFNSLPLTCPATLPPMNPAVDPTTIVRVLPVVLPAGLLTVSVKLEFENEDPFHGVILPFLVRVGGTPADGLSNIVLGSDFQHQLIGGARDKGAGRLFVYSLTNGHRSFEPGNHILVDFDVTMSSSTTFDRTVSCEFISLPPTQNGTNVHTPYVLEKNLPFTPRLPVLGAFQGFTFHAVKTKINVGNPVFFSGFLSAPVDDNTWQWDFGDGNTGVGRNPIHIYDGSAVGPFTVSASVNLLAGGTANASRFAYISLNPVIADFQANPRAGILPTNVTFTDLSTGAPVTWFWDFGDGNTSTVQNPVHTYTTAGTYTVCLTASNPLYSDTRCLLNHVRFTSTPTPDFDLSAFGPSRVRRGFNKKIYFTVVNIGTGDAIGDKLTIDLSGLPSEVTYVGSVPAPNVDMGTIKKWNLPTLSWDPTQLTFDDYTVQIELTVDALTNVGELIPITASVDQATGEVTLFNNNVKETEEVVAAIDPNDKQIQPLGCGDQQAQLESSDLSFMIQFENKPEATASALYVIVVDTLSPFFDWSTLAPGPSSHPVDFSFDEQTGEMIWIFDGINLPPNVNPPEGEGFVSYSIRPMADLPPETTISNQAYIRFDFENWLAAPGTGPLQILVDGDVNVNGIPDVCDQCCVALTGNCDGSLDDVVDISDLTALIDNLFISLTALPCLAEGNTDGSLGGVVDISDLTALIDNLFISLSGTSPCE